MTDLEWICGRGRSFNAEGVNNNIHNLLTVPLRFVLAD